jgi:hypothetical protein
MCVYFRQARDTGNNGIGHRLMFFQTKENENEKKKTGNNKNYLAPSSVFVARRRSVVVDAKMLVRNACQFWAAKEGKVMCQVNPRHIDDGSIERFGFETGCDIGNKSVKSIIPPPTVH